MSAGIVPEAFLYETLENRGIHCYNSILWRFVNPGMRISMLICQGSSRHVEESLPLSSGDKQKVTEINRAYTMELELDIIDYAVNSSLILYNTLLMICGRVQIPTSCSFCLKH